MKTTLNLDDELLAEAKRRAAASGKTLTAYVQDALRAQMLPRPAGRRAYRLDLPIVKGKAPPAVDVSDRNALYDVLDERT